jgi:hypothetical protein
LWKRNEAFYAQITVADPQTGKKAVRRTRLEDKDGNAVSTNAEAVAAMNRLKVRREDDTLRLGPKRTPTLGDYSKLYLDRLVGLGDAKRPQTIRRERQALRTINRHIGELKLRQITAAVMNNYMAKRKAEEVSARCVNIETVALRNVLRSAIEDGHLSVLPMIKRLKEPKPMRRMLTPAEIDAVAMLRQPPP